jgi:hypothetical protein
MVKKYEGSSANRPGEKSLRWLGGYGAVRGSVDYTMD